MSDSPVDLGSVVTGAVATGSPWGAIGAGVLNYLGTQSTNQQNADIAAANNQWSAQQYATRYQTMTQDMMKAGLNPMLAYSQSAGAAPTAQQVQFQNPMASATQAFNENLSTRSNVNLQHSTAIKQDAEANVLDEQVNKIKSETRNLDDQQKVLQRTAEMLASQEALNRQKGMSEEQSRAQSVAAIKKLGSETDLLKFDIQAAKSLDNLGRSTKELKPLIDLLLSFRK